MALPPSHKNPTVASADHMQPRDHAHTGTTYGLEKGEHEGRKVDYDSLQQKWASGGTISAEEEATPAGFKLRRDLYGYD